MTRYLNALIAGACACLLLTASAQAQTELWIQKPDSRLSFSTTQQGEAFEGQFKSFVADIQFDPAALASAKFDVRIDLGSVDSANSERDETLTGDDFFNVADHPFAQFKTTSFRSLGGSRYEADATLNLNGQTVALKFPFDWKKTSNGADLQAEVTLDRLAFNLGLGDWEDAETIGHDVKVSVDLRLLSKAKTHPQPDTDPK